MDDTMTRYGYVTELQFKYKYKLSSIQNNNIIYILVINVLMYTASICSAQKELIDRGGRGFQTRRKPVSCQPELLTGTLD